MPPLTEVEKVICCVTNTALLLREGAVGIPSAALTFTVLVTVFTVIGVYAESVMAVQYPFVVVGDTTMEFDVVARPE